MRKFIPYLYLIFACLIIFSVIVQFREDKEVYRIFFNWKTESKYLFTGIRTLLAGFILYGGLRRLKVK